MGFFDLNIPYHESDRHATDKTSLRGHRLKLALKAMELGYTGIAYNRSFKGVMSESDRCSTPLFPLTKLTPSSSSSFVASVKLHRELLNVAVSSPFRQYTRLTVIVDVPSQMSSLNAGNPILKSYDIVAVRPMNQNAFDQACQTSEVDIIAIDFLDKLPFRLKQHMVKAAIKRGVYFEIPYSGLIADAQSRRQMISNCKLLVDWTRGKNLILCSAAPSVTELRGPQDVANLFSLLGLSGERAKAAISKNCRSLLANVLRKKHFHKEAVKVEAIPSGEQINPAKSAFNDWLNWDPISSGGGDLLLDDMEKSFCTPKTVKENVKSINFTSNMNGLPVHGLQIKDLIGSTGAPLGPLDTDNRSDDLESNLVSLEVSNSLAISESTSADFRLESTVENQCDTDVCADKGIAVDMVSDKIDIENIHVQPLASSDASSQDVHVEGQYSKVTDNSVKLGDDFPVDGFKNVSTDSSEPIKDDVMGEQMQIVEDTSSKGLGKSIAGRKKRKRNSTHQHLFVPFKHLPKPRHSKRNSRK